MEEVGAAVSENAVGDEVVGFTNRRASHAEYVVVRAVALRPGDRLVVSAAAGGVGSIAVQLAKLAGAAVIGIAGRANHAWLSSHGVTPVAYGDGLEDRLRAAAGGPIDAFIDTFGGGYVDVAIRLGVRPERIDTIIDFAAAKRHGVKAEGSAAAATAQVLGELVGLIRDGKLDVPIAKVFPLDRVQDAYRELEQRHTRGKIVLSP